MAAKPAFCGLRFFFIIFRYAYQKMQNGLKRLIFRRENFGSKEKILRINIFRKY